MEYSEEDLAKDFFNRTLSIIEQYEKLKNNLQDNYFDITLLINSFFGLIIMPKAKWYNKLTNIIIQDGDIQGVTVKKDGILISSIHLKELLHCLRNGLAHWFERGNTNVTFEAKEIKLENGKIRKEITSFRIIGEGTISGNQIKMDVKFNLENNGLQNFLKKLNEIVFNF